MRLAQVPVIYVVEMWGTPNVRTAELCMPIDIVANMMKRYKANPPILLPTINPQSVNRARNITSTNKALVTVAGQIFF